MEPLQVSLCVHCRLVGRYLSPFDIFYTIVDGGGRPCGTIFEAAKLKGMRTGMVVRNSVGDATPASFWSHALHRSMQDLISEYLVGMHGIKRMNDVLIGGGLCSFVPNSWSSLSSKLGFPFPVESCRSDSKNLLEYAQNVHNATICTSMSDLHSVKMASRRPILGLLASKGIAYEIDRDPKKEPSLAELTSTALKLLAPLDEKEKEQGFLLLVEGSKVDIAAHENDGPAHYREVMAFQEAVGVSVAFANRHQNTLVLVVF